MNALDVLPARTIPPPRLGEQHDPDQPSFLDARHVIGVGVVAAAVLTASFLGWAGFAPLDSAMLAPGVVVVESHRKAIQHLEGGIVKNVLVTEGETVSAGQALMELDDTQARANLDVMQGQSDSLSAAEARLIAERDGAASVSFPLALAERASDPKVSEAIRGEQGNFRSRRDSLTKQVAILTARTQENARSIEGLKSEQAALDKQIALIGRETALVQGLVEKGFEALPRLLALQRQGAELEGQRGQVAEKIAQVQVNTGETELQIVSLRNQTLSDVLKDLRDVQTRRFELTDKIQAARDVLNRVSITTPVEGRVVGLAIHTQGAVIKPGDTLMEIVPDNDALEVEAHVRPEDVNDVQVGLPAKINLTAFKQRRLPLITGTVTGLSADRLVDQRTGQPYFNAQVSVDSSSWKDFPEVHLIPGMPVEVAVETGSRTALEYLFAPIQSVLRRGMREK